MSLQDVFNQYCAFGGGKVAEMDNAKFAKLCRDSKILDKKLTATDVDLIFSKVKAKGERKINFETFRDSAVPELAKKKGVTSEDLATAFSGPESSGTKADAVRFHDDKDSYTGVYKNGSPSTVDTNTSDLSFITNREDHDVRGVNLSAK